MTNFEKIKAMIGVIARGVPRVKYAIAFFRLKNSPDVWCARTI